MTLCPDLMSVFFGGQVKVISPFLFANGPLRGHRLTAFD